MVRAPSTCLLYVSTRAGDRTSYRVLPCCVFYQCSFTDWNVSKSSMDKMPLELASAQLGCVCV